MKIILFSAAIAVTSLVASTGEAMTCDNRIVHEGDASHRARRFCGEPTDVAHEVVSRTRVIHRQLPDGTVVSDAITITVPIQIWTYDFGPQRFMRRLVIEAGAIVSIETLGYGTVRPH